MAAQIERLQVAQEPPITRARRLADEADSLARQALAEGMVSIENVSLELHSLADLRPLAPAVRDRLKRLADHLDREIAAIGHMPGAKP